MSYFSKLISRATRVLSSYPRYAYNKARSYAYAATYVARRKVSFSTAVEMMRNGLWQPVADGKVSIKQIAAGSVQPAKKKLASKSNSEGQFTRFTTDLFFTAERLNCLNISNHRAREALKNKYLWQLVIVDKSITIEQLGALDVHRLTYIEKPCVRQLIAAGKMTIDQLCAILERKLPYEILNFIENEENRQLIINGQITIKRLGALGWYQFQFIEKPRVRQLIAAGKMTIDQLCAILKHESLHDIMNFIEKEETWQSIINGQVTIEQLIGLNKQAIMAILKKEVYELIVGGKISMDQLSRIENLEQARAIKSNHNLLLIKEGKLSVDKLICHNSDQMLNVRYNGLRYTDTDRVNQSVPDKRNTLPLTPNY